MASTTLRAKKGPPVPKPTATRDRILDASRRSFNAEGLQASAAYRVAADVGISAGNLAYHFKTKAEIAGELARNFEMAFKQVAATLAGPVEPLRFIHSMREVLALMWRFRFLFTTPQYLAVVDPELGSHVIALRLSVRDLIRQHTREMIMAKGIRPPRDQSSDILADNIVAIWMYWLQNQDLGADRAADEPSASALKDCLEHHFGLLEPYLGAKFATSFRRDLDITL
ncbi:transcriptional regulator, TetR family [Sphingopyxis sp. YR583]|uniref:TetR/AcrR family transcriptional regulator n=1 Tax=Sphingopyxis sp. YR583 TaxID=1881047 RepID=UPI0008A7286D|nr:TetR/AcrR family transcriptional regulator [Sphingopyxis sp. YR583]SEH19177.1 transcriptional regulator, TetR family [Sphingopyxis sp. YR583]